MYTRFGYSSATNSKQGPVGPAGPNNIANLYADSIRENTASLLTISPSINKDLNLTTTGTGHTYIIDTTEVNTSTQLASLAVRGGLYVAKKVYANNAEIASTASIGGTLTGAAAIFSGSVSGTTVTCNSVTTTSMIYPSLTARTKTEGTIFLSASGPWASAQNITCHWVKEGRQVGLYLTTVIATSTNAIPTFITISGLTSNLYPIGDVYGTIEVVSSGVRQSTPGFFIMDVSGSIIVYLDWQRNNFGLTGTCGFPHISMNYITSSSNM